MRGALISTMILGLRVDIIVIGTIGAVNGKMRLIFGELSFLIKEFSLEASSPNDRSRVITRSILHI